MDEFEQPQMDCPRCGKVYDDFDGFGVVYCDPKDSGCGYCRHMSRDGDGVGGMRCNFCGDVERA